MSERGSFVTEYIYCPNCFVQAQAVLLARDKYLCSTTIPSWGGGRDTLPIVAGKIGELYSGGELVYFEHEIAPELAASICHPLRVAVLAERGERIFTVQPSAQTKAPSANPPTGPLAAPTGHASSQDPQPDEP